MRLRSFMQYLRAMPAPVLAMFLVFLVMPFVSLTFIDMPWEVYRREGLVHAILVVATYWVMPLALCYAITLKHFLFLPFYITQCLLLFLHAITYHDRLPLDIAIARYVLVGFTAYIGVFFGNKDFLYPFLTLRHRVWRKAPRLQLRYEVTLVGDRPEHKIPAVLRDCSATGMAVSIEPKHFESYLKKRHAGDNVHAVVRWLGREAIFPCEIIWTSQQTETRIFGLRLRDGADTKTMRQFVAWARQELQQEASLVPLAKPGAGGSLLEHEMHHTALTIWVLFIVLSFGLPAFAFS